MIIETSGAGSLLSPNFSFGKKAPVTDAPRLHNNLLDISKDSGYKLAADVESTLRFFSRLMTEGDDDSVWYGLVHSVKCFKFKEERGLWC